MELCSKLQSVGVRVRVRSGGSPAPSCPMSSPESPNDHDEVSTSTAPERNQRALWGRFGKGPRRLLLAVWLLAAATLWFVSGSRSDTVEQVDLSEALALIDAGDVERVEMDDSERGARLISGDTIVEFSYPVGFGPDIVEAALDNDVEVSAEGFSTPSFWTNALLTLLPLIVIALLLVAYLMRRGGKGVLSIGKLPEGRGSAVKGSDVRFGDVAGSDEIVDELRELVDYLHEPERFTKLGATVPKGFLLSGPPGTGKTLLAKAIAGEAGVAYFALSGSDFVETFVGVGAARVRNVFKEARKAERAIIFIDELDAVGRARVAGPSNGSNSEEERTLNALLVEMDGFHGSGVLVIGATNRPEILDTALLRPGRFDRRITIGLPDRAARTAILDVHLRGRPGAENIDTEAFAKRCVGLTGADLAGIVNDAALLGGRDNADALEEHHLASALSTSVLGRKRTNAERSEIDRDITAWHEAGHATVALLESCLADPVAVSILPRGTSGGVTWLGGEDELYLTRSSANARLRMTMGGRAAEMLLLDGDYTSGAASDLAAARSLAAKMVNEWGMGESLVLHGDAVDNSVTAMLDAALRDATAALVANRVLFDAIVSVLIEDEEVDGALLEVLRDSLAVVPQS